MIHDGNSLFLFLSPSLLSLQSEKKLSSHREHQLEGRVNILADENAMLRIKLEALGKGDGGNANNSSKDEELDDNQYKRQLEEERTRSRIEIEQLRMQVKDVFF